jgi:hypothetical protein
MEAEDLVTDLVVSMTKPYRREPRELLEARHLVRDWNPDGVREILRLLTPRNCHVTLTSSLFQNQDEEGEDGDEEASNEESGEGNDDEDYDSEDDSGDSEDDEEDEGFSVEEESALLSTIPESHRSLSSLPTDTSPPLFKSKHFRMSYWKDLIPEELLSSWSDETTIIPETQPAAVALHLPPPNHFIPTNFTILKSKKRSSHPEVVFSSPLVRVWHSSSQLFPIPKGVINFSLLSNYLLENSSSPSSSSSTIGEGGVGPLPSPTVFVMNDLVSLVMNELLVQELYMAEMASMESTISSRMNGIVVSVYGYHDKIIPFASMILTSFFQGLGDPSSPHYQKILNLQIEKLKKRYLNDCLFSSDAANTQRLAVQLPHQVSKSLRLETLQKLSSAKNTSKLLQKYLKIFLSSCRCEIMIQGNLSLQQAIAFGKEVNTQFEPKSHRSSKGKQQKRTFDVPRPVFVRTIEPFTSIQIVPKSSVETNVCLQFYFQVRSSSSGPSYPRDFALLQLIERIMEEPLFNELRTQKQVSSLVLFFFVRLLSLIIVLVGL